MAYMNVKGSGTIFLTVGGVLRACSVVMSAVSGCRAVVFGQLKIEVDSVLSGSTLLTFDEFRESAPTALELISCELASSGRGIFSSSLRILESGVL